MAKKSIRKTAAASATNRVLPKTAKVSAMQSLSRHVYRIVYVPDDCTAWETGQTFEATVGEPPPEFIQVDMGGACNPVFAQLED